MKIFLTWLCLCMAVEAQTTQFINGGKSQYINGNKTQFVLPSAGGGGGSSLSPTNIASFYPYAWYESDIAYSTNASVADLPDLSLNGNASLKMNALALLQID